MTELQVWVVIGLLVANVLIGVLLLKRGVGTGRQQRRQPLFAQIRPNILIVAFFIFGVCGGLVGLIVYALWKESQSQFVIGALVGLLGSGLTGLAGLGTTLMNEGTPVPSGSNASKEDL